MRDPRVTAQPPALLLLAHGSRDRRSVLATRTLARAVAGGRPELTVRHSFLDLSLPRTGPVLARLAGAGHREVVVVPLLLTEAYHSRVDVPAVLAAATPPGMAVRRTDVVGPDPLLVDALLRRLGPGDGFEGVVLAAAGSSDPDALATVREVAVELGKRYGVPAEAGFASTEPDVAEAVRRLRRVGVRRVAVASYFLAPGRLHDRVVAAARGAGAVAVAEPLVAIPELVRVVAARFEAACQATSSRTVF
jgi:sirohydrochlorin ferrochelatase